MVQNLWANKAIISRIIQKFQLEERPREPDSPLFLQTLQPVTSIDELLKTTSLIKSASKDLSAGAGTYTVYHTTPATEKWTIRGWSTDTTIASTQLRLRTPSGQFFPLEAAATAGKLTHSEEVYMPPGWTIGLLTTGNVADTDVDLTILYDKEDV